MNKFLSKGVASSFLAIAAMGYSAAGDMSFGLDLGGAVYFSGDGVVDYVGDVRLGKKDTSFGLMGALRGTYYFTDYIGVTVRLRGGMEFAHKRSIDHQNALFTNVLNAMPATGFDNAPNGILVIDTVNGAAPGAGGAGGAGGGGLLGGGAAGAAAAGATAHLLLDSKDPNSAFQQVNINAVTDDASLRRELDKIEFEFKSYQLAGDLMMRIRYGFTDELSLVADIGPSISYVCNTASLSSSTNSGSTGHTNSSKGKDIEISYGSIDPMLNIGLDYAINDSFSIGGFVGGHTRGLGAFSKKTSLGNNNNNNNNNNSSSTKINTEFAVHAGISLSMNV